MRRDFSYPSDQPQRSLDTKRSQLRLQDNTFDNSNPYSSLLLRGVNQDFSTAFRSKSESLQQGAATKWDENYAPTQKNEDATPNRNQSDLRKGNNDKNIQNYASGSLWDSVGENQRKKNILNEYQSYMKSNPLPQYVKQRQGGGEYNQREENNMLARKQSSDPVGWYTPNNGIGILPGMDEKQENRPLQDKYRANEGSNKIGYTPSGGRLAGIGSRILDNPRDYSSVDNSRGGPDDIQNYRTPQLGSDKDRLGYKFATPQNDGGIQGYNPLQLGRMQSFSNNPYFNERGQTFSEKKIESLNDLEGYKGGFGLERDTMPKPSFHVKPKQEFTFSFANKLSGDWQDQRRQAPQDTVAKRSEEIAGRAVSGADWVSERHKQEEDKRLKQKEDLQRIYKEQIEEKKRKKQEEQRRQLLEDQKEEERLKRENEELQRQYISEQNKKKGIVEEPRANAPAYPKKEDFNMDYLVGGRKKAEKPESNPFESFGQSNFRGLEIPRPFDYQADGDDDPEVQRIEAIIKEASSKFSNPVISRPKYEYPEQELPLHKGIGQYNSALDDQLEKMKRDIEQHANLIKTELSTYKKQAYDSLELRHHAQNELLMLREELKAQQLHAENNTVEEFGVNGEKGASFKLGQVKSQDRIGLRIPNKNYSKIYCPEEEGQDIEVAPSTSLNVETQYMSAKGNQKYKELPKVEEMLHKFGNDRDNSATTVGNKDAAMQKFSMLFPSHGARDQENGNNANAEYKSYGSAGRMANDYETRQVRRDEVQGTSSFVTKIDSKNRFREDQEGDYELPGSQELVEAQH